jgi:hypothetical protein
MADLPLESPLQHASPESWELPALRWYADQYERERPTEVRRLTAASKAVLIRAYGRKYSLDTFLETGTHEGDTLSAVMGQPGSPFRRGISVEIGSACNPQWNDHEILRRKFRDGAADIRLFFGSSIDRLPDMLKATPGAYCAWLDAHANGPEDPNQDHFPLRKELEFLFGQGLRPGSVILIDDFRFFGYGYWPTFEEVCSMAPPDAQIACQDDIMRIEV